MLSYPVARSLWKLFVEFGDKENKKKNSLHVELTQDAEKK